MVRNLLTGTATKYLLLAVNIICGVLLLPFTIRHLGTDAYGLWMFAASLTYYLQLLDLGYGTGVVRHVSDADASGDMETVNRVLSTFLVVFAGLGVVALIGIAVLVTWVVPQFPRLSGDQIRQAQIVLAILGVRVAVGLPMTVFGAATTARQRFALNNSVAIAVALANAVVTYLVLSAGYGLIPLVAATTTVGLLSYLAYARTAKVALPELRLRFGYFSRPLVKQVTSFSLYLFVIGVAAQIWFSLDAQVIGAALGTSAVAIYAVAFRLADYQRQLCSQFNGLLFPVIVRLNATERPEGLRDMLVHSTRIALSLVTITTIGVIGFGEPLIDRWMGPGFEAAVVPLYILALAGLAIVGLGPVGVLLLATGQHRLVAFAAVGEALTNLALSLLLVGRFGMVGVAIGTALPVFLVHLCILTPLACRQTHLRVTRFARLVTRAPLAGAVPAIAVCALLRNSALPSTLPMILVESAIVTAVYVISLWLVGLDRDARERYTSHVRSAAQWTADRTRWSEAV